MSEFVVDKGDGIFIGVDVGDGFSTSVTVKHRPDGVMEIIDCQIINCKDGTNTTEVGSKEETER